jgi:hypothetical protein
VRPRRAKVTIEYEDGGAVQMEGMVVRRDMQTTGEVEFAGGKRKTYPVSWTDFRVIREDQTAEVMRGER